jgi:cytochrome c2
MRKLTFLSILLSIILFSCHNKSNSDKNSVLNESNLQEQFFDIDITKDTTLITASGCIIEIPMGSLQGASNMVKLEIKEAINITDILLGGLTTMAGNKPLSSAGMIYINAAKGTTLQIKKPLKVLVPTKTFNRDMQVYKGAALDNGKIDWQNPLPLSEDETIKKISVGEQLFKANCSNCHKIDQDYTGPNLLGITNRRPKKWLYDFTRNAAKMVSTDMYSSCLARKWKPTIMTAYPNLNDQILDSLYAYIKAETDKNPNANNDYGKTCCDSCESYYNSMGDLQKARNKLSLEQVKYYDFEQTVELQNVKIDSNSFYTTPTITSNFYTIEIETVGWYNVDYLLKEYDACKESELLVKINDESKEPYKVSLVIPSLKVYVDAVNVRNRNEYIFGSTAEPMKLPQNVNCFIITYREKDDKLIFAKEGFISSLKQKINLSPLEIFKQDLKREISSIGVETKVEDVKNAKEIKDVDKKIENIKTLLPKNCDCGFPSDTTKPMPGTYAISKK